MGYYPDTAPSFIWSFIGGAFSMAYTVFIIILVILEVVGRWKMYEKAGEPGWASLIPFYSSYELYKSAGDMAGISLSDTYLLSELYFQ